MGPLNIVDLPPEIIMLIIDLLVPSDVIPALQAANGLAKWITPQHVLAQDSDGSTILHYLASDGQDNIIKQFLSKRVNCSIVNNSGLTPLIMAAHKRHVDIVKLLLQAGADISTLYPNGHTIMLNMENCLDPRIVKLLIDAGANVSSCNDEGETVLVHALRAGKRTVARILIKAGADVNVQARYGNAWIRAVIQDDYKMVQMLLKAGADPNGRWRDGQTPLQGAAGRSCQILRALLDAGASVSAQCDIGTTALHVAAEHGNVEGVRLLLDAGADLRLVKFNGWTALHSAAMAGNITIFQMLRDADADLFAEDSLRHKVLVRLIEERPYAQTTLPLVKLLANSGIDLSANKWFGNTALHEAASHGLHEVVKILIEAGIDSSTPGIQGRTALHYAVMYHAQHGSTTTRSLLNAGANPSARNVETSTTSNLAGRYRVHHNLLFLLNSLADVSATDNCGQTALHLAVELGWEDGIHDLLLAGVNVFIQNNDGWTAQNLAARGHLRSAAKAIHDAEAKADPAVLSQTCRGFSILSHNLEETELPFDQTLRHLHTKCHLAGAFHCLIDVIEDLSLIGDLERIKILFETWTTEMLQRLPPEDILSLHDIQKAVAAAARNRHAPVVAYFLSLGVPPGENIVQGVKGGGSTELFQVLLDHGWDINTQYESKSSLMLCLGNESLVKWHLEHGADTSLCNLYGYNVLEISALCGDLDMVKLLIKHGMDPRNSRALITATGRGSYRMGCHGPSGNRLTLMKYLLDRGVDINRIEQPYQFFTSVQCEKGTALHAAIEYGCPVQVEFLLNRGASRNVGKPTPLEYAQLHKSSDDIGILLCE